MKYEMTKAEKGNYAVPAFNFFSFSNLVGIAQGAKNKKQPRHSDGNGKRHEDHPFRSSIQACGREVPATGGAV